MSSSLAVQTPSVDLESARDRVRTGNYMVDRYLNTSYSYSEGGFDWFQSGLPTPPASRDMNGVSIANGHGSYASDQAYSRSYADESKSFAHPRNCAGSQLSTAVPTNTYPVIDTSNGRTQLSSIASHLQIPESVNKSKGSLAEFAAEITCLFWFENADTLQYAEHLPIDTPSNRGLSLDTVPTIGFRKWVTTILSTTQVGKNVILLALMFIYRLKKFNPSVSGKRGSEFRLLTIALMLGNKFLDDNTYTNKTWAEVSGISVTEIHIMEVEFLSNMRYELYASQEDWIKWKALLGNFGLFYEKASKFQAAIDASAAQPITPISQIYNSKLPSPPSKHPSGMNSGYNRMLNPINNLPQLPQPPHRMAHKETFGSRKRSLDNSDLLPLPPAKRPYHYSTSSGYSSPASMHSHSHSLPQANFNLDPINSSQLNGHGIPQLPMPRMAHHSFNTGSQLAPLALPSARAMTATQPQQMPYWNSAITSNSGVVSNPNSQYQTTVSPIAEVARTNSAIDSTHTSPVNMYGAATPTRSGLSPSYFLINRSSPYKPVRHVNTLLIPPPSAAMQNSVRNIDLQQMHYQPLGRPMTERRVGPVPYQQTGTPSHLYRPF